MNARLAAPAVLLLVLTGCAGAGVVTVGEAADAPTVPTADAPTIAWRECARGEWYDVDGWQCGTMDAPLDHTGRDEGTVPLALTRRPAGDPSRRIGSLFVNPGGPGVSGIDAVHDLIEVLPPAIAERFDLVGFDPRGVGASSPVDCISDEDKDAAADLDWSDDTIANEQAIIDVVGRANAGCAEQEGRLLAHLGTRNAARDLDLMRQAVGDDKLTYLGFSYGTSLGATYANLFPGKVRALVLDGPVDPRAGTGVVLRQPVRSGGGGGMGEGEGYSAQDFDGAFGRFAEACSAAADCGLETPAGDALDTLVAEAAETPIAAGAVEAGDGRRLTPGLLLAGVASALYDTSSWPLLAVGLQDALDGDGSLLIRLADELNGRSVDGTWDTTEDAFKAVTCADFAGRPDARDAHRLIAGYASEDEVGLLSCLGWPATAEPLRSVSEADTPPIVVVGTVGDPATPYANAATMAGALGRGVVLTWEGDGHTAFGRNSDCIDAAVTEYLVDLRPPADGTRCPGPSTDGSAGGDGGSFALDRDGLRQALAASIEGGGWSTEVAKCVAHHATTDLTDAELVRFWYSADSYEAEDALFKRCGSSFDGP